MRAALHDGVTVVNVIEYDPQVEYTPPEGFDLVELDDTSGVGPGWRVTAAGLAPPSFEDLSVSPVEISVGDQAVAAYRNTFDDAPVVVTFDVNGATVTVPLTDSIAELEITASAPGPITIAVDQDVLPVTIRGV